LDINVRWSGQVWSPINFHLSITDQTNPTNLSDQTCQCRHVTIDLSRQWCSWPQKSRTCQKL